MRAASVLGLLLATLTASMAQADPVRILAAGSLAGVLSSIPAQHGVRPMLADDIGAATVFTASKQPVSLAMADLRALPSSTATVNADRGPASQYSGPTLWAVLQRAGSIEPDFHKRVDQVVTVTGQDGYSVTLAMGEIDPEFENKPVILATERDGTALTVPRLAIPGDKHAGRSVRDVASIVVR